MLGTVVNALAIVAGGLVGLCCTRGIDDRFRQTVLQGLALCVLLIGAKSALAADNLLVLILSLVIGGVVGEGLAIEARLEALGRRIEARFAGGSAGGGDFARGFVSASLVFCVGSMAVVGSLESGLAGNHRTLFAKAMIDGVAALIFASTLGRGVLFASVPVFLYQGAITLAAGLLRPLLSPAAVAEMSAVGGLLIVAIGANLLGIARIRVGNLLPAVFLPLVAHLVRSWLA